MTGNEGNDSSKHAVKAVKRRALHHGVHYPVPVIIENAVRQRGSFPCPDCGGKTQVISSRPVDGRVVRRRHCLDCNVRVTTTERVGDVVQESEALRQKLAQFVRLADEIMRMFGQ